MTDKVIIDGIDVSGCENLKSNLDCADSAYHLFDMTTRWVKCENCKDCYYKQLQRKEQECEELKQWQADAENILKTQLDNFDKIEKHYKQALETIKNICDEMDGIYPLSQDILDIINEVKDANIQP